MVIRREFATIRLWEDTVFAGLASYLEPLGFKVRKNWQEFHRRRDKEVRQGFHLNLGKYPREPRLSIIVSAWVRHDRVEKLVMGWRTDVSEASKRETATIGQELGVLENGKTRTWDITDDSHVAPAYEDMAELMSRVGLAYLERFSDLRNVFEALADDNSPWHRGPLSGRAHNLPVIKALVDGPETAIPLFRQEYERLKHLGEPDASTYPEFVRYVEKEMGIRLAFSP